MSGRNQNINKIPGLLHADYQIHILKFLQRKNKCNFAKYFLNELLNNPGQIFDFTEFYIPKNYNKKELQIYNIHPYDISINYKVADIRDNLLEFVDKLSDRSEDSQTGCNKYAEDDIYGTLDRDSLKINSCDLILVTNSNETQRYQNNLSYLVVQIYMNSKFIKTNKELKKLYDKVEDKYLSNMLKTNGLKQDLCLFSVKTSCELLNYATTSN